MITSFASRLLATMSILSISGAAASACTCGPKWMAVETLIISTYERNKQEFCSGKRVASTQTQGQRHAFGSMEWIQCSKKLYGARVCPKTSGSLTRSQFTWCAFCTSSSNTPGDTSYNCQHPWDKSAGGPVLDDRQLPATSSLTADLMVDDGILDVRIEPGSQLKIAPPMLADEPPMVAEFSIVLRGESNDIPTDAGSVVLFSTRAPDGTYTPGFLATGLLENAPVWVEEVAPGVFTLNLEPLELALDGLDLHGLLVEGSIQHVETPMQSLIPLPDVEAPANLDEAASVETSPR